MVRNVIRGEKREKEKAREGQRRRGERLILGKGPSGFIPDVLLLLVI